MFNTTYRVHSDSWHFVEIGLATCNVYHETVKSISLKDGPLQEFILAISLWSTASHQLCFGGVTRCVLLRKLKLSFTSPMRPGVWMERHWRQVAMMARCTFSEAMWGIKSWWRKHSWECRKVGSWLCNIRQSLHGGANVHGFWTTAWHWRTCNCTRRSRVFFKVSPRVRSHRCQRCN